MPPELALLPIVRDENRVPKQFNAALAWQMNIRAQVLVGEHGFRIGRLETNVRSGLSNPSQRWSVNQGVSALPKASGKPCRSAAALARFHQLYSPGVPDVARVGQYRFFFYSNERDEPPHIHVRRERKVAKFWLVEVSLAKSRGFAAHELRELERMVVERQHDFLRAWHEHNPS